MFWRNTLPERACAIFATIVLSGQFDGNVPARKIPKLTERRKAGGANTRNGFKYSRQVLGANPLLRIRRHDLLKECGQPGASRLRPHTGIQAHDSRQCPSAEF